MSEHTDILEKIRKRDGGMTVPPGYFDDFARRMASELPRQPWEDEAEGAATGAVIKPRQRTFWQAVRPYVYMAAMFAGVWLMMNIFDRIMPAHPDLSVDNNPVLTAAVENDSFMNDYFIDDMNQGDVYEDMWNSGATADDISLNDSLHPTEPE